MKNKSYKVVIMGPPKSGKTSLIDRFLQDSFDEEYTPTIDFEFATKEQKDVEGQKHTLCLSEFSYGEGNKRRDANIFLQDADLIIFTVDTSALDATNDLIKYLYLISKELGSRIGKGNVNFSKIPNYMIVATKVDSQHRLNDINDGLKELAAYTLMVNNQVKAVMNCSAKDGTGVTKVFDKAFEIVHGHKIFNSEAESNVALQSSKPSSNRNSIYKLFGSLSLKRTSVQKEENDKVEDLNME